MFNLITIWSIVKEDGSKKHNHIENGWNYGDYPEQKSELFTNQKAWEKMNWYKEHGYLENGKVERL